MSRTASHLPPSPPQRTFLVVLAALFGGSLVSLPVLLLLDWFAVDFLSMTRLFALLFLATVGTSLAAALWARGRSLVGPLFYYDLVRLARRGRTTLLRCAYGLFLLGALWLAYQDHVVRHGTGLARLGEPTLEGGEEGLDHNALARLGMSFVSALLIVQTGALLVLTPAYLAGAIHEERERGTLQLLFTTHVSDREIILGKLLARVAHLGGVLLTGLPVLCLVQFWGGVDGRVILAAFAATGLSLLSVGSISILFSVLQPSRLSALVVTYLTVGGIFLTCMPCLGYLTTPLTFVKEVDHRAYGQGDPALFFRAPVTTGLDRILADMLADYALVHGLIAAGCTFLAIKWLRQSVRWQEDRKAVEAPIIAGGGPLQIDERAGLLTRTPPVGGRPLLWKEVYLGGQYAASQFRDVVFLIVFSATLVMFLTLMLLILPMTIGSGLSGTGRELNAVLRCLAVLNLGLLCAAVGFRAAGSISREREQRTLDGLLSLPVDRNEILGAKWLGSLLWARGFALCVVLVLAGGLFTTAFHPGAVVLLAFAGAVHALFFASLGLWLSVACRTSLRAVFLLALVLLALLLGPWVVVTFSRSLGRGSADLFVADFLEVGLNPVGAWWFLGFSWGEARDWEGSARLAAACFGLCTYAVAAGVLWLLAELRLRREGEHGG